MPDLYAHMRLAREALGNEVDEAWLMLGALGPDPFYYVRSPKHRRKARRLGDAFHERDINAFFAAMIDTIQRSENRAAQSYLYGYLTHFALDVAAHPFVHYHVGDERVEPGSDARHLRFERAVDVRLIHEDTEKSADRVDLAPFFSLPRVPRKIERLIDHVALECYDIAGAGDIFSRGYRRMRFIFRRLVRDRSGLKTVFLNTMDRFRRTGPRYVDVTYRTAAKSDFDVLNRDRRVWRHPVTGDPSRKSFDDLYLDAFEEANRLIASVKAHFDTGETVFIRTLFGNRSLRTGLDANDKRPMRIRYPGRLD